jgi:hypothetical protein
MSYKYAVVGAGRQGIAAAYDLVMFGDAEHVLFIDLDEACAREGCLQFLFEILSRNARREFPLSLK